MTRRPDEELLKKLLRDVSRSFYLTLRVLPGRIRRQIGLAYLLARTTDTIADTGLVPIERRLGALQALRERILGLREGALDLRDFSSGSRAKALSSEPPAGALEQMSLLAPAPARRAEQLLLENCQAALGLLSGLAPEDRQLVRQVLDVITSGQELDLRRFAGASSARVIALHTDQELDDYTYRVAGCVGEFWTKMCRAHLFPQAPLDDARLIADGVRFGKGLQLVNILRDLPRDLAQGRCYLPSQALSAAGLKPADLLAPDGEARLRPLYNTHLDRAQAHLRAGWIYTNTLPRGCVRVRLACAWPILIGVRTLELLRANNVLDPRRPIKVSRAQVRWLMWRSVLYYPLPKTWRKLGPA